MQLLASKDTQALRAVRTGVVALSVYSNEHGWYKGPAMRRWGSHGGSRDNFTTTRCEHLWPPSGDLLVISVYPEVSFLSSRCCVTILHKAGAYGWWVDMSVRKAFTVLSFITLIFEPAIKGLSCMYGVNSGNKFVCIPRLIHMTIFWTMACLPTHGVIGTFVVALHRMHKRGWKYHPQGWPVQLQW